MFHDQYLSSHRLEMVANRKLLTNLCTVHGAKRDVVSQGSRLVKRRRNHRVDYQVRRVVTLLSGSKNALGEFASGILSAPKQAGRGDSLDRLIPGRRSDY